MGGMSVGLVFVIAVGLAVNGRAGFTPPYDNVDFRVPRHEAVDSTPESVVFPLNNASKEAVEHIAIDETVSGQQAVGHLFAQSRPSGLFHILPPKGGCPGRVKTSVTATAAGCLAATNAGFFNVQTGDCLGNLVSKGDVIQAPGTQNANFGVRLDEMYEIGYNTAVEVHKGTFLELVAGVTWLVRNGRSFVNESVEYEHPNPGFVAEMAPRVAVGHDAEGRLLSLVVDGNEGKKEGLDLYMMADLCVRHGFVNAVNVDGGGSATAYYEGKVINHPSDPTGERTVTSITCMY